MNFKIKHEIRGRIRVHMEQKRMTCKEADTLLYYLHQLPGVTETKVYERTADAVICYTGERENIIEGLKAFRYDAVLPPEGVLEHSGRELNAEYKEKLILRALLRAGRLALPVGVRAAWTVCKSVKYIKKGMESLLQKKMEVSVLDATAIGVSMLRRDMKTASSVMFLLGIGELLEEWTHKKSIDDLARSMSLNVSKVWLIQNGQEVLVAADTIQIGDTVVVRMGNVIPFDGIVISGEGLINQASMTGEGLPVRKEKDGYVYAGTVVEEGEIVLQVKETSGSTRFEKIVTMIEESEKLKSAVESRAEHLADRLVPYTLLGTVLVYAATRNVTKALAVLMVDFSCALKLAMPLSVLSAIREARLHNITVKGGKYLEAIADAKTIVFDKTGTLTKAKPTVKAVYSFCDSSEDEMLRIAACMEEHFPHSMAKAVVMAAQEKGLEHEETHSKVEYIVAHGVVTTIEEKRAIIGSHHFVFEDEGCTVEPQYQEKFENLPEEYSRLFLAIDHRLAAVICIEDPLREEAADAICELKTAGFEKIVMMTGDNKYAAASIAEQVGIDEYYYEVLPADKAEYIRRELEKGNKVIMIGDGINDSPALSAADVGIAISDGAEIAREIADITIAADDLHELVKLKILSDLLMKRIQKNYNLIVGINTSLIVLGVLGAIMPTTSALFHNASTLAISLKGMSNLLVE
ncbi:MAG: heavy metal translocating P-type ATPase [Bacillota bacterium]|nr:heavy metal translocating P-type ATPase [Bacillota bacterium]